VLLNIFHLAHTDHLAHTENHSNSSEVEKMTPFIYSTSMKTTVAPLKFEKCPHSYIPPA
jgi:hypothetical protein